MGFLGRIARHPVARNAAGMYGMMFAGYVLPLVTLPYLASVLRPRDFGLVMFAQSFASWSSLTVEYGFGLSATREIAQKRDDGESLTKIAAGVLGAKLVLIWVLALVGIAAGYSVANFREHPAYLIWALLQTIAAGFSPFWYFQGTEKMVRAMVPDLLLRCAATGAIFLAVRSPGEGWRAIALQAGAGFLCSVVQTLWMYREVRFRWPYWLETVQALKHGWNMFFFRGAYQIYSTANTFILGLFVSPEQVGYFGGAQRISRALQGMTVPLAQALYPRMSHIVAQDKTRAARVARLTVLLNCGVGIILGAALALTSRWVVAVGLGRGYEPSIQVLNIFALFLPINATNSALIMHWMLPTGMERTVGAITFGAIGLNLILAALLAPRFAHVGMAWVMVAAEGSKLIALFILLFWRRLAEVRMVKRPEQGFVEPV